MSVAKAVAARGLSAPRCASLRSNVLAAEEVQHRCLERVDLGRKERAVVGVGDDGELGGRQPAVQSDSFLNGKNLVSVGDEDLRRSAIRANASAE